MTGSSFLYSVFGQLAVSHRRPFVQLLLPAFTVVEVYVVLNATTRNRPLWHLFEELDSEIDLEYNAFKTIPY